MTSTVLKRLIPNARRSVCPPPDVEHPRRVPTAQPAAAEVAVPPLAAQLRELAARLGVGRVELSSIVILDALLFLSLPLIYLWIRGGNAEAFRWGWRFLNQNMAAGTTGLLLVGAAAMLWALHSARHGRRRPLLAGLLTALVSGLTVIGLQVADFDSKRYYGLLPGEAFRPSQRYVARKFGVRLPRIESGPPVPTVVAAAPAPRKIDAERGRKLFSATCASCHGVGGEGVPGSGKDLRGAEFIAARDDAQLVAFVKEGRQPWDPLNTTKVAMPPRGGNPMLTDADLADIVAFVRMLQPPSDTNGAQRSDQPAAAASNQQAGEPAGQQSVAAQSHVDAASAGGHQTGSAAPQPAPPPVLLVTHRSVIPSPAEAPAGLSAQFLSDQARPRWRPPEGAGTFFGAYFFVTYAHGIHLVAGVLLAAALLVMAVRGRLAPARCAPVALGSAVWCWGAAMWLLTYPVVFLLR